MQQHMQPQTADVPMLYTATLSHYISLQSREVQTKLLDLYTSPHMSSSVKLHIIAALEQTTRLKEGLDWLLGRHHVQVASTSGVALSTTSKSTTAVTSTGLAGERDVAKEPVQEKSAAGDKEGSEAGHITGYQRILNIMTTKQVMSMLLCIDRS